MGSVFAAQITWRMMIPFVLPFLDDTRVIIKKAKNNKYDFELTLPNGNRKTFMWAINAENEFGDRHGNVDARITEALQQFLGTLND